MTVLRELEAMAERYRELSDARDQIEELLMVMEAIDLPSGVYGSHHAEMEWSDTLCQIETEIDEIEGKLR